MMYDLTEKDIECIAQWLNKACVEAPRHLKRESDLLQKLLKQREDNVIREENIIKERSKVGSTEISRDEAGGVYKGHVTTGVKSLS